MSTVPILDIKQFDVDREQFLSDFKAAYQEWGFAGINGHGLDPKLIESAWQASARFFALEIDEKLKCEGRVRGYIPFGVEKAKGASHVDLKEFFHVGRESANIDYLDDNVWPENDADFKQTFEALYTSLDALARRILQVFAAALELPADYFDERVAHGEAILRILHYPPLASNNAPNVRAAAHEDINLITLLTGSEQDGLEVLSKQGEWVPINMIEGTIICNVGDMLQRLSNNTLRSTTHRVINPKGDQALTSRYSIPFFMHPSPEVRLDCLPQCVNNENPRHYDPITAGVYLQQRLKEIGLVK